MDREELKPRILVVDGELQNRRFIEESLADNNYDFAVVNSGQETIEYLEENYIDLVLLDVNMDGYQTCKAIRENELFDCIKVIFMHSKTETEDIERAFAAGADDFISKPFNAAELMVRIHNCLLARKIQQENEMLQAKMKKLNGVLKRHKLEMTEAVDDLQWLVSSDRATGLYRREYAVQQINRLAALFQNDFRQFSLVVCEIDGIGELEETYGDFVCDEIQAEASKLIRDAAREQDVVARWDNSRFICVLPDCSSEGAEGFAERVRQKIAEYYFDVGGLEMSLTITLGVASYTGGSVDETMQAAINALEEGENRGKNQVCTDWHI